MVFPGELFHILTKSKIAAAVHRVISPSEVVRISAPLLIRGLTSNKFDPKNKDYQHPGGSTALQSLADLEGVSMKELHKILDFKRLKYKKENENNLDSNWVLNSFNIKLLD